MQKQIVETVQILALQKKGQAASNIEWYSTYFSAASHNDGA